MKEFTVLHLCCGIGGAALGFQKARGEYKGAVGAFRTLAGIDVDPRACEDFRMLTNAPAVQIDLFTRQQYIAFHGCEPPDDWREATGEDIRMACGWERPDAVFVSAPCKGYSSLLSEKKHQTPKYQALNQLVLRCMELLVESFGDDMPAVIMIENVPRITSRGAGLLKQVKAYLKQYNFEFDGRTHDCGVIGGLGQHRRRYLLMARNREKMPNHIYNAPIRRVRSIGEVLSAMPLPGDDPTMGPMHRLPRLHRKTWVRLALIRAGGDHRDLKSLVASKEWFAHAYRIIPWSEPAGTVTSGHSPSCGGTCVADPRLNLGSDAKQNILRIGRWDSPSKTITGATRPAGGAISVADPRLTFSPRGSGTYGVQDWNKPGSTIIGLSRVGGSSAVSVADPRIPSQNIYRLVCNEIPAGMDEISIDEPSICQARNGTYGVMDWDEPSVTVVGSADVHAGCSAVADPRMPNDNESGVYIIIALDETWHRPLTALENAAIQSLPIRLPDGRPLVLSGKSDSAWRERIGNAVPPDAAQAMAETILDSLLAADVGDWTLGSTGVWVSNRPGLPERMIATN